jgi:molybdenum cofactor synthesis domain-containing protein
MMGLNLFEKTEMCIRPLAMRQVNLTQVAEVCARVLAMAVQYVQVIDAREDFLTLDITAPNIRPEQIFGKEKELLEQLQPLDGLEILPETRIHSDGILGSIALPSEVAQEAARRANALSEQIKQAIRRRAVIFPSGIELLRGEIEDTNTPFLTTQLESVGMKVTKGEIIPDDFDSAVGIFHQAVENGFGLAVSTGGVGAEAKDVNVEAARRVCDMFYAPEILHFQKGTGRHAKGSVCIGVGMADQCTIVNLPGPHAEVTAVAPILLQYCQEELSAEELAEALAQCLRRRWSHHGHHA